VGGGEVAVTDLSNTELAERLYEVRKEAEHVFNAALDALLARLEAVTRERDEARADLAIARDQRKRLANACGRYKAALAAAGNTTATVKNCDAECWQTGNCTGACGAAGNTTEGGETDSHRLDECLYIEGDGYKVICSCGWESWENPSLRDAERIFENHALSENDG
jgi:BMFP domain-containing protein YqiC